MSAALTVLQAPLTRLLARNKLSAKDVDAVELLGGGSRVPKLQAELSTALGGRYAGLVACRCM
jgi:molecular chaperone DnaK (HSP70)